MNALFPAQLPNQLLLVMGEHAASHWMLELAAWLSMQGPVRVLDGGNRFNAYPVAQSIRRQNYDPRLALGRIRLSRAFTCYQVHALLTEWPVVQHATLVFDLLATFYDESVNLPESQRLLRKVLWQLEQLSKLAPVVVSTRMPATICAERMLLFEMLKERAGSFRLELEMQPQDVVTIAPSQPTLLPFPEGSTTAKSIIRRKYG
ncbi:MAG: hypothetical protein BGO78_06815 [Chloroflexi bacterium 44-23]|nr:MAG: hypothetical protein BGO78_06815 [Chloroflexi bacterium 44-23]